MSVGNTAFNNLYDNHLSNIIWMGISNLDPDNFNEQFIKQSFHYCGEKVKSVKIIKSNKGQPPFSFVEFDDVDQAKNALNRLNGKTIPHTNPAKIFKLNPASYTKDNQLLPEFSLHVGDLTPDVDDYRLFSAFQKNYKSTRGAKVVLDNMGKSKGFGFVRFSDEGDQLTALIEMQHMTGIGSRPIRVGMAAPKPKRTGTFTRDYSNYKPHYNSQESHSSRSSHGSSYNNSSSGSGHGGGGGGYSGSYTAPPYGGGGGGNPGNYYSWGGYYHYSQNYQRNQPPVQDQGQGDAPASAPTDDLEVLEDPCLEVHVAKENREFIESSESFFEALDRSRWFGLDTIQSEVPA